MPLRPLLKNKLLLEERGTHEVTMDLWPFWQFEEAISILNELAEERDKERNKQSDESGQSMPNMNQGQFNPNTYVNQMNQMTNNINFPNL